jgi:dihydroxyacid dehydratase/phosphogluconate dehydratase
VLHAAPEAAVGGPLSLVRDGDEIELDVEERRLDLLVSDDELERRRRVISEDAGMDSAQTSNEYAVRGYVRLYREHVMQADPDVTSIF